MFPSLFPLSVERMQVKHLALKPKGFSWKQQLVTQNTLSLSTDSTSGNDIHYLKYQGTNIFECR